MAKYNFKRLSIFAISLLATGSMIAVMPEAADASTNTNTRHGIVVKTPHDKTAHNGSKVTVSASVHPKAGQKRRVTSYKIGAYKNGHRVAYAKTVKLKPGTYKLNVRVTYQNYRVVTKTRSVGTAHDPDYGYPANTQCVITAEDTTGYPDNGTCTSADYPGETVQDNHEINWCPTEDSPWSVGQTVHNQCAVFAPYYTTSTQRYQGRVYGKHHAFTSPKRTINVKNKTTSSGGGGGGSSTHSCTATSSGSCIRGGEFCPQASYGDVGYDANGTAYVCEGDTTHPHWE